VKYAVEMGSVVTLYKSRFIKICSGIQKFKEGIYRHTDSMEISYTHFGKKGKKRMLGIWLYGLD
jgi:hypothetical protein